MQPKVEKVLDGFGVLGHIRPGHCVETRLEALRRAAAADGDFVSPTTST